VVAGARGRHPLSCVHIDADNSAAPRVNRCMTRFGCLLVAALLALTACGPSAEPAGSGAITVNPDTPFDPIAGAPAQDTAADAPPADAGAEPPADGGSDAGSGSDADAGSPEEEPADRLVLGNRERRQFGDVAVGQSVTRSFAAFVTSADPDASVTAAVSGSDAFSVGEPECAGGGGQRECRIRVTFAPLRQGPKAANLVVTLDGADPKSLALTGVGARPAVDPSPEPSASPEAEAESAAAAASLATPAATPAAAPAPAPATTPAAAPVNDPVADPTA
jgi:hypothetical protein